MKKILLILMVVIFGINSVNTLLLAEEKIRVMVEVDGAEKAEVKNYIDNTLAGFKGVENVNEDPGVYIHVITRKLIIKQGERIGYVMSAASAEIIKLADAEGNKYVLSNYNGLWLEVGPDLDKLSKQCALAVNAGAIEEARESKKFEQR